MNINEIGQQLTNVLNKSGSLFISSGDDFSRELTLGQIIKGKVLRSFEGGRYEVDFSGQKKTVDSSIPLKPGELINGRVISVGEQIEIKRLSSDVGKNTQSNAFNSANDLVPGLVGKWESLLIQKMREYNIKFNAQQKIDLIKVMKQVDNPEFILLSAAALLKQKIDLNRDLLLILNKIQPGKEGLSLFSSDHPVPQLSVDTEAMGAHLLEENDIQKLALVISSLVGEQEKSARSVSTERNSEFDINEVARPKFENTRATKQDLNSDLLDDADKGYKDIWHLVNNQVDGSVQHRVSTLPFWVNGRLAEVDVVMYEQHSSMKQQAGIESRKIVFSLDLEKLGHVSVEILLHNKHIKMAVSTNSTDSTEAMFSHGNELTESIKDQNWGLDEVSYLTNDENSAGNVVRSVLEYYVSQNSLSRLM